MDARTHLATEISKELNMKEQAWESWESFMPSMLHMTDNSCVGLINSARLFYEESGAYSDLLLWKKAIDRAEQYAQTKAAHKYINTQSALIRAEQLSLSQSYSEEKQAKTQERIDYINKQRSLMITMQWDQLLKKLAICEDLYIQLPNKERLHDWTAAFDDAEKFSHAQKWNDNVLATQRTIYQLEKANFDKNNSCFYRCLFFCFPNKKVDTLSQSNQLALLNSHLLK